MRGERMLARGRHVARDLMQTTVIIRRGDGVPVRNPETGEYETGSTVVYEGPARLRFPNAQPREADAAGQRFVEQSPTVSLPIASSADVDVDDVGEVTANPLDPGIVGLRFRIAGVHAQTHSTARRFPVEVVTPD